MASARNSKKVVYIADVIELFFGEGANHGCHTDSVLGHHVQRLKWTVYRRCGP